MLAEEATVGGGEAAFWTWRGVVALATALMFLGKTADWLTREQDKPKMLSRLKALEDRLASTPIKSWVLAIARAGLTAWSTFTESVSGLVGARAADEMAAYYRVGSAAEFGDAERTRVAFAHWGNAVAATLLAGILMLVTGVLIVVFRPQAFVTGPLTLLLIAAALLTWAGWRLTNFDVTAGPLWIMRLGPVVIASVVISMCALVIGASLGDVESLSTLQSMWLVVLNLPFDAVSIIITLLLLDWMVRNGSRHGFVLLGVVALVDVIASAVLALMLYACLAATSFIDSVPGPPTHSSDAIVAWLWRAASVPARLAESGGLAPLVLTSFAPIALYMSSVIMLGLCVGPLIRLSGYIAGRFGEKQNTPMLELAVFVSMIATVAKALSDWDWLVDRFVR